MSPSGTRDRVVSVLIVDDDSDYADLIRLVFTRDERIQIVGEAADGASAIDLAAALQPDVVILDIRMPGMNGIAALTGLRQVCPSARVIIFSAMQDSYRTGWMNLGAADYVNKAESPNRLLESALRETAR